MASKQIKKIPKASQLKVKEKIAKTDDIQLVNEQACEVIPEKDIAPVIDNSQITLPTKDAVEVRFNGKDLDKEGTPSSKDSNVQNFTNQTACVSDETQSEYTESSVFSKSSQDSQLENTHILRDTTNSIIDSKLSQPYQIKRIWYDCKRKDVLFELTLGQETDDNRLIISRRELATKNKALLLSFYESHLEFSKFSDAAGFSLRQPKMSS